MNRIILVGNGFDLAHGLKTRYEDFINWYFEQLKKTLAYYDYSYYEDGFCTLQVNFEMCGASSWRNFIHPNKHKIFNMGVNGFLEFLDYHKKRQDINATYLSLFELICMSISTKGWVDIENDYYELLKRTVNNPENNFDQDGNEDYKNVDTLHQQLTKLQGLLSTYLKSVQDVAGNDLTIASLNDIINEPIRRCDIATQSTSIFNKEVEHEIKGDSFDFMSLLPKLEPVSTAIAENCKTITENRKQIERQRQILNQQDLNVKNILILDFNYTNTTDKYKQTTIHIHGKLDTPKSIIFGYGDELDENYKKLSNLNDNRYLTNMKSIRYLESGNYRDMLRFINAAPYQIYIMGHSCGNSDRTLLNTLFEHENCVSIKPFYYQKDDENDNYSEITQNISRNFTNMQSFRDKVVNKTLCESMPQI